MYNIELAYIQKRDGEFINSSAYQAWEGFRDLGIPTECFEYKHLINGYLPIALSKNTLVCGYISTLRQTFEELNIPEPKVLDYPLELTSFLGRNISRSTLKDIKMASAGKFIKPVQVKSFKGILCKDNIHFMMNTAMCPDDTEIYVSDPVEFLSEYRVFVNQKIVVGCKHYAGDFTLFPDINVISAAVEKYTSSPISYAIDFGITKDGRTLLVEVNDAWSLGCYGLDSRVYAELLLNRWEEIVNDSNTSIG